MPRSRNSKGRMSEVSDAIEAANAELAERRRDVPHRRRCQLGRASPIILVLAAAIAILARSLARQATGRVDRRSAHGLPAVISPSRRSSRAPPAKWPRSAAYWMSSATCCNRAELAKIADAAAATNTTRVERAGAAQRRTLVGAGRHVNGDFSEAHRADASARPISTPWPRASTRWSKPSIAASPRPARCSRALADANLTHRMNGQFAGALAKLKTDTNAVGDKLTERRRPSS